MSRSDARSLKRTGDAGYRWQWRCCRTRRQRLYVIQYILPACLTVGITCRLSIRYCGLKIGDRCGLYVLIEFGLNLRAAGDQHECAQYGNLEDVKFHWSAPSSAAYESAW